MTGERARVLGRAGNIAVTQLQGDAFAILHHALTSYR